MRSRNGDEPGRLAYAFLIPPLNFSSPTGFDDVVAAKEVSAASE
jgi:hypothetical protein